MDIRKTTPREDKIPAKLPSTYGKTLYTLNNKGFKRNTARN
jgi:hypothetical protein